MLTCDASIPCVSVFDQIPGAPQDGLSGNKTFAAMDRVLAGLTGEKPSGVVVGQTAVIRQLLAERSEILELDLAVRLAEGNGFEPRKLPEPPLGVWPSPCLLPTTC